ncbi:MAG TPA: hypothetical protein VFR14_05100 [Candidatus Limnocylindrales bacterium]|nr:hypothetical protein [Candidatus Limnocylindrales bacterium]
MNDTSDFDRLARAWLAEGPRELSDRVLAEALDEAYFRGRQRRLGVRTAGGQPGLSVRARFGALPLSVGAFLIVAIVAAIATAAILGDRFASPGGLPGQAATAAPSDDAVDPTGWIEFRSDRYGFSLSHPRSWTLTLASRDWVWREDRLDWMSNAAERFAASTADVSFAAFSLAADAAARPNSLSDAYYPQDGCTRDLVGLVTIDGHAGEIYRVCGAFQAVVDAGARSYSFALWRTAPNEAMPPELRGAGPPHRDFLSMLEAVLATVDVHDPVPLPAIDTTAWLPYRSDRYGFSVSIPAGWTVTPAERDWSLDPDRRDWLTPAAEHFASPAAEALRASAWVVELGSGESFSDWINDFHTLPCPGGRIEGAIVDGRVGNILFHCTYHGVAVVGNRVFVLAIWTPTGEEGRPPVGATAGDERVLPMLRALLSTVDLDEP